MNEKDNHYLKIAWGVSNVANGSHLQQYCERLSIADNVDQC